MSLPLHLRPIAHKKVIDLVREAGLDVSDWSSFAGGRRRPAMNPKYCYEWAFMQPDKPVLINLWYADMEERNGVITWTKTPREWFAAARYPSHPGRLRSERLDKALQEAARAGLPVRVIIIDGKHTNSPVATGPTRGPQPTSWSGTVSRNANQPAITYALQFGNRNVWKIGHAVDVDARLTVVNTHGPHEVLGEHWHIVLQEPWPTESTAHTMEQALLRALRTKTSVGERVTCTRKRLEGAWNSTLHKLS